MLALVAAAMRVSKVVGVGVVVEGRFVPIDVDIEGRVVVLLLEIMVMVTLVVEMAVGVLVGSEQPQDFQLPLEQLTQ